MDAKHIVEFLNSMGERGMAEEVMAMHNRLEAFASGLDRNTFNTMARAAEEAFSQRDELLAEKRKVNVTFTGKEIQELAELAGLVIAENDYTEEHDTEITVKSWDGYLLNDDGEEEYYRLIAYITEYPDEGAIGLGDKIEPAAIVSTKGVPA